MTQSVKCRFFYGINYSDKDVYHLKKIVYKENAENAEILPPPSDIKFWKHAENPDGEFWKNAEIPTELEDAIGYVDQLWAKRGDPVRIYYYFSDYSGGRQFACLCLRETFHCSPSSRMGLEKTSFNLDGLDLRAWDLLLKAKCERLNFPWDQPAFHLIATVYEDFWIERVGYCFYGLFLGWMDKLQIGGDWNQISADWNQKNDPVTLLRVEDRPYDEGPEGDRLYLGIRASFMKAKSRSTEQIAELNLPVQTPSTWKILLRKKCIKYEFSRKEPKFYLFVMS